MTNSDYFKNLQNEKIDLSISIFHSPPYGPDPNAGVIVRGSTVFDDKNYKVEALDGKNVVLGTGDPNDSMVTLQFDRILVRLEGGIPPNKKHVKLWIF